jgi:hypothetical protein
VIGAKMLARVLSVTGRITSRISLIMPQLAIAAIEIGEERIALSHVSDTGLLWAVLGKPV